jgi:BirA family transcriptional regulator, biotin operon repressor / biotin---[acetyl-CoA-carboxylase] ligase
MPLDIARIRALRPQNNFRYFATVGSTMSEATQLASSGAAHGTVVVADEQTSGIGRLGREWISEAELGIYCSILLRLPLDAACLPIASLLLGLATADALQRCTDLACDLRWPNDVLIEERKVAGILPHLIESYVIAGIGINVNQTSFPSDLRTPATSLYIASGGRLYSREVIILTLLESIDILCSTLATQGPEPILRAFSTLSSYAIGRRVVIEENGAKGITAGLDENGFLLVRSESGHIQKLATGGVRPDY